MGAPNATWTMGGGGLQSLTQLAGKTLPPTLRPSSAAEDKTMRSSNVELSDRHWERGNTVATGATANPSIVDGMRPRYEARKL